MDVDDDDDDDDDDVREQHNTTTQTRKKEREKRLPQKGCAISKRLGVSRRSRLSSLVFFVVFFFRPLRIKERKRETKSHFLGFQKILSESTDSRVPISDLLLSSSPCRGLYLLETTLHTREVLPPFGPLTIYHFLLKHSYKKCGAGTVSRHRRFDDDVGPPSPRWWWWWFWVRSKTTKRVHHSKVFLDKGNSMIASKNKTVCARKGGRASTYYTTTTTTTLRRCARRRRTPTTTTTGVSTTRNTNNVFFFFVVSSEKERLEHVRRKRLRRDRHRFSAVDSTCVFLGLAVWVKGRKRGMRTRYGKSND